MTVRQRVREAARFAGVLPALKKVRAMTSAKVRRGQRDDVMLSLLLEKTLRAHDCCVDVGASKGDVLRDFVKFAPRGRHVAFEPVPHQAVALKGAFPGVTVRQEALAAEVGTLEFRHVVDRPEYSGLQERSYPGKVRVETIEVAVNRLDDALAESLGPDTAVRLLKIDVEGAELGVLQGGLGTLRQHRPIVVFEHGIGGADHYGTTPEMVWDLLAGDLGYGIYDMDGEGPYSREMLRTAFDTNSHWNWIARD